MEKDLELFAQAAEQLEELKAHLDAQKTASERLKEFSVTVGKISDQVALLPVGLQSIIERAQRTEDRLNASAEQFQAFRDSFPSIVERLENSDYGRLVSQLLEHVEQLRTEHVHTRETATSVNTIAGNVAESFERLATSVDESVQRLVDAQEKTSLELATLGQKIDSKIEGLVDAQVQTSADLVFMRDYVLKKFDDLGSSVQSVAVQAATNTSANAAAQEQLVSYLKATSELQMNLIKSLTHSMDELKRTDVVGLRSDVTGLQRKLDAQTEILTKLASKKGIFFG